MSRDLSLPYDFLQIAEVCQEAGRLEEAVQWAERGMAAFPARTDWRLREFLANEYHRLGRHDEAVNLIWEEFAEQPRLDTYQKLTRACGPRAPGPEWREKALAHARKVVAQTKRGVGKASAPWYGPGPDNSLLVEILLWEKDVEGAWQEAQAGGCRRNLWRRLAQTREETHPEDALSIYREEVEPTLSLTKKEAYAEAIRLLHKINKLMGRLGRGEEFGPYVESIRNAHKRKRNFIKLLDRARWGPSI